MSLLLDALKRAEQEKLARNPSEPARAAHAATPMRDRPAANAASLELQPLTSASAYAGPASARAEPGAHGAQSAFQAKAPAPAGERGRGMIWATIGAVAVVVIAAGAYVWYSVKSLTPQVAVTPRVRPPPLAPAPAGSVPAAPDAAMLAAGSAPLIDPVSQPPGGQAVPRMNEATAAAPASPAEARPREDSLARVLRESSAAPADAPLRLDRSGDAPRRVPPDVAEGYEALREGNISSARRSYAAAITQDPANLDAVLGMATIEARSGNRPAAALQYRRALELDPRNATALAGLAALADFSRPESIEAQLRSDLMAHPDSAALHFTLGNVYASRSRWTEAQSEYFEAHRLDPGSADVMFNLAVAIDNLGQARLAAGFYQRALEAANGHSAQFDTNAVKRRLAEIH